MAISDEIFRYFETRSAEKKQMVQTEKTYAVTF